MMHAAPLQAAADIEWYQIWFAIPDWLGYMLWTLLILVPSTMMFVSGLWERPKGDVKKSILLRSLTAVLLITVVVLVVAGRALSATTETNRTNLQDAYGVDLTLSGDEFLVHGTDKRIRGYVLPDGQTTNITFRVELTERDGVARAKLFTVNDDGSTQEVPRVTRLKLDGELDTSSTEPSSASSDQSGEPDKGSGLNIRDDEVREYLNSVTKSDVILKELQSVSDGLKEVRERLAEVESK